ncbi:hypothetical protein CDO26_09300 [Sinorhizobium meliloti]|uniref:hypothetical protein n=1 Tax=Sinorhizobium TaxID=28105 RepID=UPI000B4A070F|nr:MULTISPECIES: hypothetical protein [Sinorhizobium]ASP84772.1 hypothetical protein CDO26_09300 [Sinorhizobium meliloti]MBO1963826.1 hypothetical protein [Sinorhizobium medicae]MQW00718.1 hypothetical protein [Sinorhizobium medicae]MQW27234.1 hypothetical protein [Sinorhizobium meliloti]
MLTKRYHFSVKHDRSGESIHAFVPDEGSEEIALKRVKADDPVWLGDVTSHGLVEWFETISFKVVRGEA